MKDDRLPPVALRGVETGRRRIPAVQRVIDPERNAILKEYEFGVWAEQVVGTWENLQTGECGEMPIPTKIYAYEDGPFAGEDVRDVARQAIDFLRGELDEIEAAIGTPRPQGRRGDAAR